MDTALDFDWNVSAELLQRRRLPLGENGVENRLHVVAGKGKLPAATHWGKFMRRSRSWKRGSERRLSNIGSTFEFGQKGRLLFVSPFQPCERLILFPRPI